MPDGAPQQPQHGRALRLLGPAALVVLVIAADFGSGNEIVYGVLCAVPLLSAILDRPRVVLAWGLLCCTVEVLLGVVDDAYDGSAAVQAQAVRLAFLALTTALGMALSDGRAKADLRLRRMTDVARTAQSTILRDLPRRVGPWQIAVDYTAAAQEARVGGDLYDVLPTERGLLLLVGDVRGKGLSAVRLASLVLGTFRHPDNAATDPGRVLAALDRTVELHASDEDFVTAVLAEVTADGGCRLWNAGHPPPLLVRRGDAVLLEASRPSAPLGLGADPLPDLTVLEPGDRLLLYTDGLVEARRPQDRAMFPLPSRAPQLLSGGTVQEAVARLRAALEQWTGGSLSDDVALLVAEQDGRSPGPSVDREAPQRAAGPA